jgi:hypothetical protein
MSPHVLVSLSWEYLRVEDDDDSGGNHVVYAEI